MIAIIGLLVGLVVGLIIMVRVGCDLADYIVIPLACTFCGLLTGVIIMILGQSIIRTVPADKTNVVYTDRVELIALQDSLGYEGSGFVISTHVESELKYLYIYEAGEAGNTVGYLDADKTYIRYIEEGEEAYFQKWHREPKNKVLRFLFISDGSTYYTLYLPKSSVIEGVYKIDLE